MFSSNTLNRFIEAQQPIYPQVVKELSNGKKITHWMWFIFPQIKGLGHSSTAIYFSIKSIKEAQEYINHPVLGKRLIECATRLMNLEEKTAETIFGYPDYLKLKSSMTLFEFVGFQKKIFTDVLEKYFEGKQDQKTLDILCVIDH